MRETYVMRNGELVPKHVAAPLPDDPRLYVISDTMAPLRHMASGKVFDSKQRFRAETKAYGCIEIGNDRASPRKPAKLDRRERSDAIRKAIYELRNGRG